MKKVLRPLLPGAGDVRIAVEARELHAAAIARGDDAADVARTRRHELLRFPGLQPVDDHAAHHAHDFQRLWKKGALPDGRQTGVRRLTACAAA